MTIDNTITARIDRIYTGSLKGEIINPGQFSAGELACIRAYQFLDPKSALYGHIICFLTYQDHLYKGTFCVHTPGQSASNLANRMTNLDEMVLDPETGILMEALPTAEYRFWDMAFWTGTRFKDLETEGDRLLRTVMNSLRDYSRVNNLCAKLRKTDKLVKR